MDAGSATRAQWRSWLPRAFHSRVGVAVAAGYYVLYLVPIAVGVGLDASRFHWILSGAALATAVVWLYERRGAARVAALAVNAASSFANLSLLASLYIQGEGFNAQFFYHVDWETLVVGSRAFAALCIGGLAYWLLVALWPRLLPDTAPGGPGPRLIAAVLAGAVALNATTLSLGWHVVATLVAANRILLVPKMPREVTPAGVARPRDLVVVVAESLEATLSREDVVGEDLTPALTALAAEGLQFTDMRQVSHTGWTTGALVASWCGEPMVPTAYWESMSERADARMPGRRCLGDVLAAAGYRGVFMVGHPLGFADVGGFYAAHGFTELLGLEELAPRLQDPAYRSGWGLYDDTLLGLARAKAVRLAADEAPFALVVLTMDTHFPPGSPSRSCGHTGGGARAAFTVRCADRLLAAFIRDVRDALPDAVVVLYSDHLSQAGLEDLLDRGRAGAAGMGPVDARRRILGVVGDGSDPGVRRLRFAIWDPVRGVGRIDRAGTHFDIMPTVLDVLGFEGWREHGFGKSLLRGASPWLAHPHPDALQIVHRVPTVELRPDTEISFAAGSGGTGAPVIDIDGVRMLATGRSLGLDAAAFAVAFDADLRASRILDADAVVAVLGSEPGPVLIGVSGHRGINERLLAADGAALAYFVGRIGSPALIAGSLPPGGRATVRAVDVLP